MKVCRGLRLHGVLSVVFSYMHAWFDGKSCVACLVNLAAVSGLVNEESREVGCKVIS